MYFSVVTCKDEESNKYFEGATWYAGICINCSCHGGNIYCTKVVRVINSRNSEEIITEYCEQTGCDVAKYVKINNGVCEGRLFYFYHCNVDWDY